MRLLQAWKGSASGPLPLDHRASPSSYAPGGPVALGYLLLPESSQACVARADGDSSTVVKCLRGPDVDLEQPAPGPRYNALGTAEPTLRCPLFSGANFVAGPPSSSSGPGFSRGSLSNGGAESPRAGVLRSGMLLLPVPTAASKAAEASVHGLVLNDPSVSGGKVHVHICLQPSQQQQQQQQRKGVPSSSPSQDAYMCTVKAMSPHMCWLQSGSPGIPLSGDALVPLKEVRVYSGDYIRLGDVEGRIFFGPDCQRQEASCRNSRVTTPPNSETPSRAGTRQQLEVPRSVAVPRARMVPVPGAASAGGGLGVALLPMAGKMRLEKSWAHSWQVTADLARPAASVSDDGVHHGPPLMAAYHAAGPSTAAGVAAGAGVTPGGYNAMHQPRLQAAASSAAASSAAAAGTSGQPPASPFSLPMVAGGAPLTAALEGRTSAPPPMALAQGQGQGLGQGQGTWGHVAPLGPTTPPGCEDRSRAAAAPVPRLSRLSQSAPLQPLQLLQAALAQQAQLAQPLLPLQHALHLQQQQQVLHETVQQALLQPSPPLQGPLIRPHMAGTAVGGGLGGTPWLRGEQPHGPPGAGHASGLVDLVDHADVELDGVSLDGTALDAALLALGEVDREGGADDCDGEDDGYGACSDGSSVTRQDSGRSSTSSSGSGGTGDSGAARSSVSSGPGRPATVAKRMARLAQSAHALVAQGGARGVAEAPWLNSISCPTMHSRLHPARKQAAAVAAAQQLLAPAAAAAAAAGAGLKPLLLLPQGAPTPETTPFNSAQLAMGTVPPGMIHDDDADGFEGLDDSGAGGRGEGAKFSALLSSSAVASAAAAECSPLTYTFSSSMGTCCSSARGSSEVAVGGVTAIVTGPGGAPMLVGGSKAARASSMPGPMPSATIVHGVGAGAGAGMSYGADPVCGTSDSRDCRMYRAYSSDLYRSSSPGTSYHSQLLAGLGSYRQAYQQQQWNWVAAAAAAGGAAAGDLQQPSARCFARSSTGSIPQALLSSYAGGSSSGYAASAGTGSYGAVGSGCSAMAGSGGYGATGSFDAGSGRSTPTHQATPQGAFSMHSPLGGSSPCGSHTGLPAFGAMMAGSSAAASVCGSEASFCSDPPADESIIFSWISTRRRVQGMDPLDAWAQQRSSMGLGGLSMAVTLGAAPTPTPLIQRYATSASAGGGGGGAEASGSGGGGGSSSSGCHSSGSSANPGGDASASGSASGFQGYGAASASAAQYQNPPLLVCAPTSPRSGAQASASAAGWWQSLTASLTPSEPASNAYTPNSYGSNAYGCNAYGSNAYGFNGAGAASGFGPGADYTASPPNGPQEAGGRGGASMVGSLPLTAVRGTARVAAAAAAALDSLHALREKQRRQRRYAATRTAFAGVLEEEEEMVEVEIEA